ncbi:hypothetical protein RJ640_023555 [Escallonia rubra]|uniref:protein-serine/threonine phosphatase n=1 Tax=Escallonia rubra TaxID=112253 RepID=A0AA88RUG9_9ASTE|nr:hypothetical protein RJ640_023555 [Escallonia rubra]
MKGSITTAIRGAIPDSDNAKLYLAHIEKQFQGSSKAHVTTLITKMVTLKYSGSNGVSEHILRMNDMASQLKGLDMEISDGFLVHLKEKGKGKKFGKGNVQGNKSASVTKTDKASSSGTKGSSGPRYYFCKDKGHMRKECHKFREWLENKGATVHITNSLQGFLSVKKLNKGDRNVLVGNGEKAQVEAVGTLRLVLESGFNLDLVDTVYVPSMTRNLISVSRLDAYGYSFKFENKGFSFFLYSRVIGSGLLEGNLYKLLLNASFTESLKTMNVNDVVAKTCGTPQQNGVAERRNCTLMDMVRSMICQSTLPEFLWVEALKTAVHILNRVPIFFEDAEYSWSSTPRIINLEEIQDHVSIHVIQKVGAPLPNIEDNDAPEIRDTSVLVRLRPAWEDLRSYLIAKGCKRFEVYVCTMAERDYALEMWRLLDPEAHLIGPNQLLDRVVCVKSGARKSLFNVFQDGNCHPKMAMVIDDRMKVWEDKDQPRVHVVPAFTPYYAPQQREFDENILRSISDLFYEDEVASLPAAPDASNYMMSEDASFVLNGSASAPMAEGMHGPEVAQRLNHLVDFKSVVSTSEHLQFSVEVSGCVLL